MREFITRAVKKSHKMDTGQLKSLIKMVADEYALLEAMMDSLNDGVIICDKKNKIVKTNRAAARILGHSFHETGSKEVWNCIEDKSIAAFIKAFIESQSVENSSEFLISGTGDPQYIELSALPLVIDKKVRGTIIIIDDITQKKLVQIKNHRLESLASLTNIAAAVAHEIKNPLAAISIHIQLLKKMLKSYGIEKNQKLQKHFSVVQEEIDRLNKIIVDFLFSVKPMKLEFTCISISDILFNLAKTFTDEFNKYGISISVKDEKDLPKLQGDERFLRQAFMNILTNAKAAMPNGGVVEITAQRRDDFIIVIIADSGTGIPKEILHKIFEPYFTTKETGTGLGLTLTYKVIKEHGGDIHVYSEAGSGTIFKIALPIIKDNIKLLEFGKSGTPVLTEPQTKIT